VFCIDCGQELPPQARFCSQCGSAVGLSRRPNSIEGPGEILRAVGGVKHLTGRWLVAAALGSAATAPMAYYLSIAFDNSTWITLLPFVASLMGYCLWRAWPHKEAVPQALVGSVVLLAITSALGVLVLGPSNEQVWIWAVGGSLQLSIPLLGFVALAIAIPNAYLRRYSVPTLRTERLSVLGAFAVGVVLIIGMTLGSTYDAAQRAGIPGMRSAADTAVLSGLLTTTAIGCALLGVFALTLAATSLLHRMRSRRAGKHSIALGA